MKSPKTLAALSVVLILLLSFNRLKTENHLNIDEIKVLDLLTEQELGTRPSHNYMFYVKTSTEKISDDQIVEAKIYIVDRKTNQTSLIGHEIMKLNDFNKIVNMSSKSRKELAETKYGYETPYNFYELLQFEPIYRNFVDSTSKLL
ncbi:MAG: hypothetical protein HC798_01825 [Polaribacter sp.]|nr:hypothetical protein [Polaribacter sp.]